MERIEVGGMVYEFEDGISLMMLLDENADRVYESVSTNATPPNVPLTLEELREMDGEPVWVCDPNDHLIGRYGLVWVKPGWHQDNFCVKMLGGIRAYFSDYNNTWLAYHRNPEEVQR